jgi:hypothetical protein
MISVAISEGEGLEGVFDEKWMTEASLLMICA